MRARDAQDDELDTKATQNIFERLAELLGSVFAERRTRVIALLFVIIVIGVIAASAVLISSAGGGSGTIDVHGGADPQIEIHEDARKARTTITTNSGNPVQITISVAEGQTSLMSVSYDDANDYSATAVGPFEHDFLVSESLIASFGNPDAVTVTQNGEEITVNRDENGNGVLELAIETVSGDDSSKAGS